MNLSSGFEVASTDGRTLRVTVEMCSGLQTPIHRQPQLQKERARAREMIQFLANSHKATPEARIQRILEVTAMDYGLGTGKATSCTAGNRLA